MQVLPINSNRWPERSGKGPARRIESPKKSLSISVAIARSFEIGGICGIVKMALLPSSVNIPAPVGQFLFSAPSNFTTEDKVGSGVCSTGPAEGTCWPWAPSPIGNKHTTTPIAPIAERSARIDQFSAFNPLRLRGQSSYRQVRALRGADTAAGSWSQKPTYG